MLPVLIVTGAIGTGKSTLAVALASRFGALHLSSDALRSRHGHGFDRMKRALEDACREGCCVILDSTGMSFRFRAIVKGVRDRALHVHLTVNGAEWERRERQRGDRAPLPRAIYGRSTHIGFDPLPDLTLDTTDLTPDAVAALVAARWKPECAALPASDRTAAPAVHACEPEEACER